MAFVKQCRQSGYTLIELMVGLLVGLIVLSGVLYALLTSLSSSRDVLNSTRLNQELSTLNDLISGELRRAGHWPASAASAAIPSPYSDPSGEIPLAIIGTDCVLYSYDVNDDESIDDDERLGFRLASNANAGWIEARIVGVTAMDQCGLGSGTWEPLTDDSFMDVTSFGLSSIESCFLVEDASSVACGTVSSGYVSIRDISIYVEARVLRDSDWAGSVRETVKIRNNDVVD
ncbi:PilW family protein [Marinobacterium lutimaris]|uniref:Prepilin-type N-terminal cleavage/methylation domain-containing protein n=1 Tax=Marinobacterium lutimaris TaxID=568106 RepID=A0A1H6CWK6_9GAMM|nr:prepilin-type N-terminal cleavage/methylation domain-containing protein [Marinobacterium lutimaris]SEG76925.1 prepilin-type N-terminal cleavage/methylation domain-containing protein [Marinobacterium lutimaris]